VGVRRSFRFLLRPTGKQAAALTACLEEHRELYNTVLEHRRTACRKAGVTVRYGHQPAELKHIRADDPDGQARWSFSSQQATLRRLDKAFTAFFKRVRQGRAPGFPRFKGKGWFDTVKWPKDGDGCRWDSQPGHPTATFVRLRQAAAAAQREAAPFRERRSHHGTVRAAPRAAAHRGRPLRARGQAGRRDWTRWKRPATKPGSVSEAVAAGLAPVP
jgi:putative transposase